MPLALPLDDPRPHPDDEALRHLGHAVLAEVLDVIGDTALEDFQALICETVIGAFHSAVQRIDRAFTWWCVHLGTGASGWRRRRLTWRPGARSLRKRCATVASRPKPLRGARGASAERTALRKIRDRHEAGLGLPAQVRRAAYQAAARAAFGGDAGAQVWEDRLAARQRRVRGLYLAQAGLLRRSLDPRDRELGAQVEAFVQGMPTPDSQRLALARELRAANTTMRARQANPGRDRAR